MLTILMDQKAIESALADYVASTAVGVDLSQQEVSIKLTAGRQGNGWRAKVCLTPLGDTPETNEEVTLSTDDTADAAPTVEADVEADDDGPDLFED